MHKMLLPYLLRTVRLVQSCHGLSSMRIPSLLRNYCSRSGLPLLQEIRPWTPSSISFRLLYQESADTLLENGTSSGLAESQVLGGESVMHTSLGDSWDRKQNQLRKKMSCEEVLDAFSSASHTQQELYCSIRDMWHILIIKKMSKPSDKELITKHPNFFKFCYEVMTAACFMPNKFLVFSLHVFVTLNVNQKTRVIQTLLNVCQQRLSLLKQDEISVLGRALKMMKSDKNVELLAFGLSLLMELKCDTDTDVRTLQNLMRVVPPHLAQRYEEKASQMVNDFTEYQCIQMFSVLTEMNMRSERLLDSCSQRIINCLDDFSCGKIKVLTSNCVKLCYFNENLLSAIGDCVARNIKVWTMSQVCQVLLSMSMLRYRHILLLDTAADRIMQELESVGMNNFVMAVNAFSTLNHFPEGKENEFLEALHTGLKLYMNSMGSKELLRTVYNLCCLGLVSPPAINNVLENQNLSSLNCIEKAHLGHIKQCLLMKLDQLSVPMRDLVKVDGHSTRSSVIQCHDFLKNYFKDQTLYQENMQFLNKYIVDFVLAFDREQSKLVPTRDFQKFDRSQNVTPIAVLCCTASHFTLGNVHPVGKLALKMRQLKSNGFTIVLINVPQFMMLTAAEKVEFLRENIEVASSIQNSVQANEKEQAAHHEI